MTLETLQPDPSLSAADFDADDLAALGAADLTFKVWGGDWCIDCKQQLPAFGAALAAAGVDAERIEHYPVTKTPSGKEGPGVEEYDIDLIPTVVVERDGEEVARFVEQEPEGITAHLAAQLSELEASA
ncbi:hypothetical protein JCM17823_02890 [Halorubrum gandharaense]